MININNESVWNEATLNIFKSINVSAVSVKSTNMLSVVVADFCTILYKVTEYHVRIDFFF